MIGLHFTQYLYMCSKARNKCLIMQRISIKTLYFWTRKWKIRCRRSFSVIYETRLQWDREVLPRANSRRHMELCILKTTVSWSLVQFIQIAWINATRCSFVNFRLAYLSTSPLPIKDRLRYTALLFAVELDVEDLDEETSPHAFALASASTISRSICFIDNSFFNLAAISSISCSASSN